MIGLLAGSAEARGSSSTLRQIAMLGIATLFGPCATGCGSSDNESTNDRGVDAESGLPHCGNDPSIQPDKCVDAFGAMRCKVNTGYAGDELALCEPAQEDGMLIHFGPKDYTSPQSVAPFLLPAGAEQELCLYVNTTNTTTKYFRAYNGRMRPNSHHLIVTIPQVHHETDSVPWKCGPQIRDRWLFGSQDPQIDVGHEEGLLSPGDPDYGLAHDIPPKQTLLLDFHNVNTTEQEMLSEAWAVLRYMPEDEVRVHSDLIAFYQLRIDIPPLAATTTERLRCSVPKDPAGQEHEVYLGLVTGHAHERLTRFSVWHDKLDHTSDLIYETLDWADPGNAVFRNVVENPALPLEAGQAWGAKSGYVKVLPGETISFECEYQNNRNVTVRFGETSHDEMCNLFGHYYPSAGGMWNCFPH